MVALEWAALMTLALAFGVLITLLIIFGSLWIMANMDHNMAQHMPERM